MNLLEDAWIPVRRGVRSERINLQTLLTGSDQWHISLPRDDMEMATLQLLICIVQTILPPKDRAELRDRVVTPLSEQVFESAVEAFRDWFQLDHPKTPFMQTRGVEAKESTPIQKLFVGLPEGNNHAFFNEPGEIHSVCSGCSAIALFNQASNCPGFGGGFKAGLRGGAPVTTLVAGNDLRETIWLNILTVDERDRLYEDATDYRPTWVDKIHAGDKIAAGRIGLARGLLWQPACLELEQPRAGGQCDACGIFAESLFTTFNKTKFVFEVDGFWLHPHSPVVWDFKKQQRTGHKYLSFTTTAPAWTWLSHFLVRHEQQSEGGRAPAVVVSHFLEIFDRALKAEETPFLMHVAGYRVKQAAVLERRHELYSLPRDWKVNEKMVNKALEDALNVRSALRRMSYGFAKQSGANIHQFAERVFYHETGPLVYELLRRVDRREGRVALDAFRTAVRRATRRIFDELTEPYRHSPEGMQQYARFQRALNKALYLPQQEEAA